MASFDNRLDAAIDELLAGAPATDLDPELAVLLTPGSALLSASVPEPAQHVARGRMMASVRAQQQRPGLLARVGLSSWQVASRQALRLAPMVAVAILIVLILLSNSALPGQPHYPLKRGVEALRVLGIQDNATRSVFYVELAERRLTELEWMVKQERPLSVDEAAAVIESIGQAWAMAWSTPGADADSLREAALDHTRRLQVLIPLLPPQLQAPAQEMLDELMRLAGLADPSPTPTPAPSPTVLPTETPVPPRQEIFDTPISTAATTTPRPIATSTPTPTPTATATTINTNTPEPTTTATNPPPATATPDTQSTLTPTFTAVPTNTPVPAPTRTPTQPAGSTQTPGSRTPEPEESETPEPEESETPEPDETEEPEPEESETPEPDETEEPEPEEPEETETPETSNFGLN